MIAGPTEESFKLVEVKVPLFIPHAFATNLIHGARAQLDTLILNYIENIGVMITYHDVNVMDSIATVLTDVRSPYIACIFRVSALVFKPQVGQILVGVVNNLGLDHIGLLVHGAFNASVHADHTSLFEKDLENQCWISTKDHLSRIAVGSTVAFEVTEVKVTSDLLSIIGSMNSKKTGLVKDPSLFASKYKPNSIRRRTYAEDTDMEGLSPSTKRAKTSGNGINHRVVFGGDEENPDIDSEEDTRKVSKSTKSKKLNTDEDYSRKAKTNEKIKTGKKDKDLETKNKGRNNKSHQNGVDSSPSEDIHSSSSNGKKRRKISTSSSGEE